MTKNKDKVTEQAQDEAQEQSKPRSRPQMGGGGGSPVYGLGMIGALVWYWRKADSNGEKAIAVGKALVWPAFLVHEVLRSLDD